MSLFLLTAPLGVVRGDWSAACAVSRWRDKGTLVPPMAGRRFNRCPCQINLRDNQRCAAALTPSHITHQPISPRLACHSRHRVLAHHSQPPYRPFTGLVEQSQHGRQLAPPACHGMLRGRWSGRCARLGSLRTIACGQMCRWWRLRTTFPCAPLREL